MFIQPNTAVPNQVTIVSANLKDSQSLATLKEALDNNSIHYKIIDANNQSEIKNLQVQMVKLNFKHMIILENSNRYDLQFQSGQAKDINIVIYCYPKKHPSGKYTCLPNAGKVVNTYNNFISERDSSSRIRLKSVCKSPQKIYPIYSKIFVHKTKQISSDIYKRFAKYILVLPNTEQFQAWRDLKKQKPAKNNKYFALMSIDESEDLIKHIYDNRISQYCDIGIVGVKPTQKLFCKNIGIASQDIAKIIDFVSQRGFNLHSIKPKIARNLSFQSCSKTIDQQEKISQLVMNSDNPDSGLGKLKNKDYYQLPLSQIPQRKQTMFENSKYFDSQECNSQQLGTDSMSNLAVQSHRIVGRTPSKKQKKSKWAQGQDKQDDDIQHGYYSVQEKSFNSKGRSKKNLSAEDKNVDYQISSNPVLQNDEQSEKLTYKSDKAQSFIHESKDQHQIISNSGRLNNSHQKNLNSELHEVQNNGNFVIQKQATIKKQVKRQAQSEKYKEQTSILQCDAKSDIKQQNGRQILSGKLLLSELPQIIINYAIKEQYGNGNKQSFQENQNLNKNKNPFQSFEDQKLQSKSQVVQNRNSQLVKQIKGDTLLARKNQEQSKQENNQSQQHVEKIDQQSRKSKIYGSNSGIESSSNSKREGSMGQSQENQQNLNEGDAIGLDSNIRVKQRQEGGQHQSNINQQAQTHKDQNLQTLPCLMNVFTRPNGKYFPSKIIQEMSQQYKSGKDSQATFLNEQLPNEGSLVSKSNKRSNTVFETELSSIQSEHKNKQRFSSLDFRQFSKSPQPSLNTITQQQKAQKSFDVAPNQNKQASKEQLSKKQLAQILSQQIIAISSSKKSIEIDDGSKKLENSTNSFQLPVYLDKMNSRILRELQIQKQNQKQNQKQQQQSKQNQGKIQQQENTKISQYAKIDPGKDIKLIQGQQTKRKSLLNFRKQNPCPQQIVSQQVQTTVRGVKAQKGIKISRFSLLNQVGVQQINLCQSRCQLQSVKNIQENAQLKLIAKQNKVNSLQNIAEAHKQSVYVKQPTQRQIQKQFQNANGYKTCEISDRDTNINVNANAKQKRQSSDIKQIISNILSPQKSNGISQAPTNLNAISSHATIRSLKSIQNIVPDEHNSSYINVHNRKVSVPALAPTKIIKISDINLQNYYKTIDQKGRVIYKSRSSSVTPIQSSRIPAQTPIVNLNNQNYHEQKATVKNSYEPPINYDNPVKQLKFASSVHSPQNRQIYRSSVKQTYYNTGNTYLEKYAGATAKDYNINNERYIQNINNAPNAEIVQQIRSRIISEKTPENIKMNTFADNYTLKQSTQLKNSDNFVGSTFRSRNPLLQSQQKIGFPKALQIYNSNGFGYAKQSSMNSGQLGLSSQIATNQFKDRTKKISNLKQDQDKKSFLKGEQNVYGLAKGKNQKSTKLITQNRNYKQAKSSGTMVSPTQTHSRTKSNTSIKSNGGKSVDSRNSTGKGREIKNTVPTMNKAKNISNAAKEYQLNKEKQKYIQKVQLPINQTQNKTYESKRQDTLNSNNNEKVSNNQSLKQRTIYSYTQRQKYEFPKSQDQIIRQKSKQSLLNIQKHSRNGSYQQNGMHGMNKSSRGLTQIMETSKERTDSNQHTHLHTSVEMKFYPDRCFQYQASSFKSNYSNTISHQKDASGSGSKNVTGSIRQQGQIRKMTGRQVPKEHNSKYKFQQETQGLYFEGKSTINKKQATNRFVKSRQSQVLKKGDSLKELMQNRTIMNSYNSGQKSSTIQNENKKYIKGPVRNKKVWKISQPQAQNQKKPVNQPRRSRQYYENYFNS